MGTIQTILIFVLVLGVLVFVHELGHFLAAKRGGVRVDEFGFGFPPRIFGKKWRGTLYSLNWIPLGGFVKIKGVAGDDEQAHSDTKDPDSFGSKSYSRKLLILFAGIGMNCVLAAFLFSIVYMVGFHTTPESIDSYAKVHSSELVIAQVIQDGPAQRAGLQAEDVVTTVNGKNITTTDAFQEIVESTQPSQTVTIEVMRDEQTQQFTVPVETIRNENKEFPGVGVGLQESVVVSYPWYMAIWNGITTTGKMIGLIFMALLGIFTTLFTQGSVGESVSGPVGIAVLTGQVAQLGITSLLQFMAVLSINLAIFNLLPIPALDGGRIIFVILEAIRRKPVDQRIEAIVHNVGFIVLLLLVVLVTLKDLIHYNVLSFLG